MDFYVILGVGPDASAADIKRAYRRLARLYHPGINPGDRAAEARFRQISEAYETLIDPRRRQAYDAGGGIPGDRQDEASIRFTEFDFSAAAQGAQAATFTELFADVLHPSFSPDTARPEDGSDIHAAVTVAFADAMRGVERQLVVTRQVPCGLCAGAGRVPVREARCPHCQGTGKVRWARGHMVFSRGCTACGGAGRQQWQRCAGCTGQGRATRGEPVTVHVPAGAVDGLRLRLPERGHAGRRGGRTGDLYVTVHVQTHPLFRREGDDLHCTIPVAVHEAVLGARIAVPSFDGPIKLRIPPGTRAGQRFRLSGHGAPGSQGIRGDLIVEAQLVLPPVLDERSRELMREFGERNPEDVRRNLTL